MSTGGWVRRGRRETQAVQNTASSFLFTDNRLLTTDYWLLIAIGTVAVGGVASFLRGGLGLDRIRRELSCSSGR
jgi:hypothetical protein